MARRVIDPVTGTEYRSVSSYARAKGLNGDLVRARLRRYGKSIEFASYSIELASYDGDIRNTPSKDHLGRIFKNRKAMYEAWGVKGGTFYNRLSLNWDIKKILTTPVRGRHHEKH